MSSFRDLVSDVWNEVKHNLQGEHEVRLYWSEADLVHSMANMVEQRLRKLGKSDLVHVAPFLGANEELFGKKAKRIETFLEKYNKKTGRSRSKLAPDIVVVNANDSSDLLGCVEVKLLLGTNWWKGTLSNVADDYHRVALLRGEVFPEAVLCVAFDPQTESLRQKRELKDLLDKLEKGTTGAFVLRHGC